MPSHFTDIYMEEEVVELSLGEFVDESYKFDQVGKSGKTLKPHKHPHPPGGPRVYTGGSKLKRAVIGTAIGGAVPLALAGVPALKALRTLGRVSKRRKFDELSDDLYTFDQTAKSGRPLAAHKHPHPPGGPRVYTGKGPGGGRGTPFNKGEKAFLKVQREIGNPNPNKTLRIIGLPKEYNPKTGVFTPSKRPKRKRRLGNILGR